MRCSHCQSEDRRIVDTRPTKEGLTRRRTVCNKCETRVTTYELLESEYKQFIRKRSTEQTEIRYLRLVIDWLLRSIFSERMNNDIKRIQRAVNNPSKEMKERLQRLGIDLTAYQ